MTTANISDSLIEEFLMNVLPEQGSLRQQYLHREAMYSLVRLAKSEQMLAVRQSVNRLVPASLQPQSIKRSRGKRLTSPGQHKLAFGKQE